MLVLHLLAAALVRVPPPEKVHRKVRGHWGLSYHAGAWFIGFLVGEVLRWLPAMLQLLVQQQQASESPEL